MTPVEELIMQGYHQTSRAFRHIARLPEGMTGRQALFDAEMKRYRGKPNEADWEKQTRKWCMMLSEAMATDQYLRVYAEKKELSQAEFDEFRKKGGCTAR